MPIRIRTIQKAVLVPVAALALSLTLAAPPALAQPAATVLAHSDCSNLVAGGGGAIGGAAGALGVGAIGGPVGEGIAAAYVGLGTAIGLIGGCGVEIASKGSTTSAPPAAPNK